MISFSEVESPFTSGSMVFLGAQTQKTIMIPTARKNDLVLQESGPDILIYDLQTNREVCLNCLYAFVWRQCDGEKTPYDIRQAVEKEFSTKVTEDVIWHALEKLYRKGLLTNEEDFISRYQRLSDSNVARTTGIASAICT